MFTAHFIERVGYETLIPAEDGLRQMDVQSLRAPTGSLLRFSEFMPVVINRRTGNIVGGPPRARANVVVVTQRFSKGGKRSIFEICGALKCS